RVRRGARSASWLVGNQRYAQNGMGVSVPPQGLWSRELGITTCRNPVQSTHTALPRLEALRGEGGHQAYSWCCIAPVATVVTDRVVRGRRRLGYVPQRLVQRRPLLPVPLPRF